MKLTTVTNVSLDGVTQGHRRIDVPTRPDAGGQEVSSKTYRTTGRPEYETDPA